MINWNGLLNIHCSRKRGPQLRARNLKVEQRGRMREVIMCWKFLFVSKLFLNVLFLRFFFFHKSDFFVYPWNVYFENLKQLRLLDNLQEKQQGLAVLCKKILKKPGFFFLIAVVQNGNPQSLGTHCRPIHGNKIAFFVNNCQNCGIMVVDRLHILWARNWRRVSVWGVEMDVQQ